MTLRTQASAEAPPLTPGLQACGFVLKEGSVLNIWTSGPWPAEGKRHSSYLCQRTCFSWRKGRLMNRALCYPPVPNQSLQRGKDGRLTKGTLLKASEVELGQREPAATQKPSSGHSLSSHCFLGHHPGPLEGPARGLLSQQTKERPSSRWLVCRPAQESTGKHSIASC